MTEPPPGWQPPAPGWGPPAYPQPAGYPAQPYGYAYPPPYSYAAYGVPGQIRSTGGCIGLMIGTLGIYVFIYNYKVHDEMKRYSGRGIGGGIALLLTFVANVAMPFVTPAEVGSLYSVRGERPPVNGWTGLWYLLPFVGGYLIFIVSLVALIGTTSDGSTTASVLGALVLVIYLGLVIGGGLTWFIKTNGALNRFWASVGVPGAA